MPHGIDPAEMATKYLWLNDRIDILSTAKYEDQIFRKQSYIVLPLDKKLYEHQTIRAAKNTGEDLSRSKRLRDTFVLFKIVLWTFFSDLVLW